VICVAPNYTYILYYKRMNHCKIPIELIDPFKIFKSCIDSSISHKYENAEFDESIYTVKNTISGGTYVFRITVTNKPYKLIIKVARKSYNTLAQKNRYLEKMKEEVQYGIQMDKLKIGPKIYDYFYVSTKYRNIKYINQYIIMESMTKDADKALDSKLAIAEKIKIVNKMILLISDQINNNVFCVDVKPQNYAVNIKNGKVDDVKMIDFGKYCYSIGSWDLSKEDIIRVLTFQILLFLYDDHRSVFTAFQKTTRYKLLVKDLRNVNFALILFTDKYSERLYHYFDHDSIIDGMVEMGII